VENGSTGGRKSTPRAGPAARSLASLLGVALALAAFTAGAVWRARAHAARRVRSAAHAAREVARQRRRKARPGGRASSTPGGA
jgi:hypothetical protein